MQNNEHSNKHSALLVLTELEIRIVLDLENYRKSTWWDLDYFFYRYILLLQFFFAVQKKFPNLRCIFSLARCFFLWFLFLCLKGGLFLWYFVDIKWQKLDHKRQIMYWRRRCKVYKFFGSKVHIFSEGHKILRNLHLTFILCSASQTEGEDFAKFNGLLRIYEL